MRFEAKQFMVQVHVLYHGAISRPSLAVKGLQKQASKCKQSAIPGAQHHQQVGPAAKPTVLACKHGARTALCKRQADLASVKQNVVSF